MRGRTRWALAWALAGASVLLAAVTTADVIANLAGVRSINELHSIDTILPVTFAGIGFLIATRQPESRIGWIFLAIAIMQGIAGVASALASHPVVGAWRADPGWAAFVQAPLQTLIYPGGLAAFLLMLFPTGKLISRRWLVLALAGVVASVILTVLTSFDTELQPNGAVKAIQNPLGIRVIHDLAAGPLGTIAWLGGIAVLFGAAISLVVRLVRSRGEERQQIKWFVYAVAATVGINVGSVVLGMLTNIWSDALFEAIITLGFGVALPASAGIAILKYRLYDIDVVISRTIVYGALAGLITAVYVGIVVGIGALVGSGGRPNLLLSIFATAVVAVGFQPIRGRLTTIANRLVYGRRATPYEVLSRFSERVAETYAAEETLPRMATVLAEGTDAERASVWLRSGGTMRAAASWPALNGDAADLVVPVTGQVMPALPGGFTLPVRHQGELLGALSITKRGGEGLTPVEEKLVDDLANQAGLVLKNVGLTSELQARLDDLRASRQRLVRAQDEERRRLERNLHDGAQQNLVALKVKVGLAEMLADRDPSRSKELLGQIKADTDEALETLRDLARGIYPPLLADQGLVTALESQARKATVPVEVLSEGVARYSQDVESAVYFCVLEALQNVQKYASATSVQVRLAESADALRFQVKDDGAGFDAGANGARSGLQNMRDRLDALGGTLEITSAVGEGTLVSGRIPT